MSDFNLQAKGLFGRYCRIEMFRYGVPNEFYKGWFALDYEPADNVL